MTDPQNDDTQKHLPRDKAIDLRKSRFEVELIDGRIIGDVRVMPGDIVGTERQFNIRATDLENGSKLEHMLYMVWLAAKRKGYDGEFEAWVNTVVDLDIKQGGETANPTQSVQ